MNKNGASEDKKKHQNKLLISNAKVFYILVPIVPHFDVEVHVNKMK